MKYWLTQSLLNSWLYIFQAEDSWADSAHTSFLDTLNRRAKEPTKAMLEGIHFEDLVNQLVAGGSPEFDNETQGRAARLIAKRCMGGQSQVPLTGELTVSGFNLVLYGICDYVKAGRIIDIKRTSRYEYGKYFDSPQHPMYLYLLPEARRFDYLIFDGQRVYQETYRREDCRPIQQTIQEFFIYLSSAGLLDAYKDQWAMTQEREEKRYGIYQREE